MAAIGLSACGSDEANPPVDTAPGAAGSAALPTVPSATAGGSAIAPVNAPSTATPGAGAPVSAGSSVPPGAPGAAPGAPGAPEGTAAAAAPVGNPGDVTYHKDIRPIMEARCTACHVSGGVMKDLPLDTWTGVEPAKGLVVTAVMSRRMPPWLADSTNCTPTRGDQRLTEAQLALFTSWQTAGFPVGVETDFKPLVEPPVPTVKGPPDIIVKANTPERLSAGQEYYSCLQTDYAATEDRWIYAMDVVPDHPEFVHHAIVNIGGGNCDALGLTAENIYSYRPGSRTLVFEEGDALLFPAGQTVSIQFHYNTKFAKAGEDLGSDASEYRLWTLPAGQSPMRQIKRMPNHDLSINIAVGAVDQMEGNTQAIGAEYTGGEIIGISPHMHYLGQKFHEDLNMGGKETCLVDIPDWDQGWQLDYLFDPKDYIPVTSGGSVSQTCIFSNRPEDQGKDPTGMAFTPQYTTFGEDTRQEMCLGYIWFRIPLSGAR